MCGADALTPGSPALAKYYVVHDGPPQYFWKIINQAALAMGFADLEKKMHLPVWLLYSIAYVCLFVTKLTRKKFKLTPFSVKMLLIHRYFSLENAKKDLKYEPVLPFEEAWPKTIEWFKINWLPKWKDVGTSEL